jgi:hypothetical protein
MVGVSTSRSATPSSSSSSSSSSSAGAAPEGRPAHAGGDPRAAHGCAPHAHSESSAPAAALTTARGGVPGTATALAPATGGGPAPGGSPAPGGCLAREGGLARGAVRAHVDDAPRAERRLAPVGGPAPEGQDPARGDDVGSAPGGGPSSESDRARADALLLIKRLHKALERNITKEVELRRDFKQCRQTWKRKLKSLFGQRHLLVTNPVTWNTKLRALRNLHLIDLVQFVQKKKRYQRYRMSLLEAAGGSLNALDWISPDRQRPPIPLEDGEVR